MTTALVIYLYTSPVLFTLCGIGIGFAAAVVVQTWGGR